MLNITNCFLLSSILAASAMLLCITPSENVLTSSDTTDKIDSASTSSPSFPNQEIIDPTIDWINLASRGFTKDGDRSTDIKAVDYSSDGKELNAILWLYFPFNVEPRSSNEYVNYGMFVDADFDESTGFGGIDYKVELSWNNQTKIWTKTLEKWSHFGDSLVLDNQTIPYTNSSNEGSHYVLLSADLDAMHLPKKYKVIFYGEVKKEGSFRTDFTRWVAIPPLDLTVSTLPTSVELKKGEEKTIEVKVNTTQGYEPTVNLHARSPSGNIIFDFTQNDTLSVPDFTLRIPSYGTATTPLTITSSNGASTGPYTLFIFANSSFPPEEFIKARSFIENRTAGRIPSLSSENIFTQSSLLVTLQDPLTLIDNISDFWNKVGAPISFIYGILAGISPWIFSKIKERLKDTNKQKQVN
jgi:hypothetical protein